MKSFFQFILLLGLSLFFCMCQGTDPSQNATRLRVHLTDAPFQTNADGVVIREFNVEIVQIDVSAVEDSLQSEETWTKLDFKGGIYNLVPLSNGKAKLLVDQYFPSGVLRKMRIKFGTNGNLKTVSHGDIKLALPTGLLEGIVVDVKSNLYANYVSSIIIDINAALSLREDNGNFYFKPHMRVFPETYGGSLKGFVLPAEAKPSVFIMTESDTLLSFPETADGRFLFRGLQPGKWKIHILADPASGYKDTVFVDSIFSGKTTEIRSKITLKSDMLP